MTAPVTLRYQLQLFQDVISPQLFQDVSFTIIQSCQLHSYPKMTAPVIPRCQLPKLYVFQNVNFIYSKISTSFIPRCQPSSYSKCQPQLFQDYSLSYSKMLTPQLFQDVRLSYSKMSTSIIPRHQLYSFSEVFSKIIENIVSHTFHIKSSLKLKS